MVAHDVTLRDELGRRVTFHGELVAETSTRTPDATRWTELALYRRAAGGYVFHSMGQSLVYHRGCDRGVPIPVADLPPDALPCGDCQPLLAELTDHDEVRYEETRHAVTVCETAEEAVAALSTTRPGQRTQLTKPARRLLETAIERDEGIRAVTEEATVAL